MKATIMTSLTAAAMVLSTGIASAQQYATQPRPIYSPPMWQHHASTFEEGIQRGWADVVRAVGEYRYNTSLALIHREEARRRLIANKKRYVQTYFDVREINRQERAQQRGARASREDLARYARERAPNRLNASQYQVELGKLAWPSALQDDVFAPERAAIDQLIAERTDQMDRSGKATDKQIQQLSETVAAKLKARLHTFSPSEYLSAKKFLASLQYEMEFVPVVSSIAAR